MIVNLNIKHFLKGVFILSAFSILSPLLARPDNPFMPCIEAEQIKRGMPADQAKEFARLAVGGHRTLDPKKAERRVKAVRGKSAAAMRSAADLEERARAARKRTSEMEARSAFERAYVARKRAAKENAAAKAARTAIAKARALERAVGAKLEASRIEVEDLNRRGHELKALIEAPLYYGDKIPAIISSRANRLSAIQEARQVLPALKKAMKERDALLVQLRKARAGVESLTSRPRTIIETK